MLVHMAIANEGDTFNVATYLLIFLTPLIIFYLTSYVTRLSPIDRRLLAKHLLTPSPPGLRGRSRRLPPRPRGRGPRNRPLRTRDKHHVVSVRRFVQRENQKFHWKTYLFVLLWTSFRVGCCIEASLRAVLKWLHSGSALQWLHSFRRPRNSMRVALQASDTRANDVRFDSDSFAVGVDNHASRCMGNDKRLFENLVLARTAQRVGGISQGLEIKGKGTLVININDDNGKPHRLKIPNSLFLPNLKMCLLSPQHWAQEAGDNYPLPNGTRMENNANNCKLLWGQGLFSKTIPFDDATNTPIFYTSPSTSSYRAFVHTFQALEAPLLLEGARACPSAARPSLVGSSHAARSCGFCCRRKHELGVSNVVA